MEGDGAVRLPDGDRSSLPRPRPRRRREGDGVQRPGPEGSPPGLPDAHLCRRAVALADGEEIRGSAAVPVGDEEEGGRRGGGRRAVCVGVGVVDSIAAIVDLFLLQFRRPNPMNPHAFFPASLCKLLPRAHVEDQDLRRDAHAEKRQRGSRDGCEGGDVADRADAFRRAPGGLLGHSAFPRFKAEVSKQCLDPRSRS